MAMKSYKPTTPGRRAQTHLGFEEITKSRPEKALTKGKPKTGGLESLAGFFPRIRKAYLIGKAAAEFALQLDGRVPYVVAGTLERAVDLAARDADACELKEPVVLLSPACASFDQYRNFEVRGDRFRALVQGLAGLMPA